ncbi:S8 family serine peptidase [Piscinibacter terrae]|nr:S8 family serine peptidase [Albitalea terrae]
MTWEAAAPAFNGTLVVGRDPLSAWRDLRPLPPSTRRVLVPVKDHPQEVEKLLSASGFELVPIYRTAGTSFWTAARRAGGKEPANANGEVALQLGGVEADEQFFKLNVDLHVHIENLSAAGQSAPQPPVLGVIDDRIGFLHSQFCKAAAGEDARHTRFIAVWDQTEINDAALVAPWQRPGKLSYGRELIRDRIDEVLASAPANGRWQESAYQRLGLALPFGVTPWSHGTHVLGIAGGLADPFSPGVSDAAAAMDLIAVQLPSSAVEKTHGAWLNAYVLDGLHYILDRAPSSSPVVVNVSLGGSLGPRDGSSLLERAIQELIVLSKGRLTVVLAAGNSRQEKLHAHRLLEPAESASFVVEVADDDPTPNMVEFWMNGIEVPDATIAVSRMSAAGGVAETSGPVSNGQAKVRTQGDGLASGLVTVSSPAAAPNGVGVQAFIGLGQTAFHQPNARSEAGRWQVEVTNRRQIQPGQDNRLRVHAWIVRDDIPAGHVVTPAPQQIVFTGASPVEVRATVSSMAGTRGAIVVGGYVLSSVGQHGMFAGSGQGHTPAGGEPGPVISGPDLCGPAAVDGRGVPDVWFLSDVPQNPDPLETRRKQGTSMAAPYVARRLANAIAGLGTPPADKKGLLGALLATVPQMGPPAGADPTWTSTVWI